VNNLFQAILLHIPTFVTRTKWEMHEQKSLRYLSDEIVPASRKDSAAFPGEKNLFYKYSIIE